MDARANLHVLEGTEEEQRAEAKRRGLVMVPPEDIERVNAMGFEERRAYLARLLATQHDDVTAEARRKLRNKRKAERRKHDKRRAQQAANDKRSRALAEAKRFGEQLRKLSSR